MLHTVDVKPDMQGNLCICVILRDANRMVDMTVAVTDNIAQAIAIAAHLNGAPLAAVGMIANMLASPAAAVPTPNITNPPTCHPNGFWVARGPYGGGPFYPVCSICGAAQ